MSNFRAVQMDFVTLFQHSVAYFLHLLILTSKLFLHAVEVLYLSH